MTKEETQIKYDDIEATGRLAVTNAGRGKPATEPKNPNLS